MISDYDYEFFCYKTRGKAKNISLYPILVIHPYTWEHIINNNSTIITSYTFVSAMSMASVIDWSMVTFVVSPEKNYREIK